MSCFEKICLNIYKSVPPVVLKGIIPLIDITRKLKGKPRIPIKEKMAEIKYPDFKNEKVIMLHGVSVGEIVSLENLIKEIKKKFKNYKIVLTTGTTTAQEIAKKKYSEYVDFITYFPLDIYKVVEKFLNAINPSIVLIAETELWPNFSFCCKKKNIPLYIINGRISDKSYPTYKKIQSFFDFKYVFACFEGDFCQSELDKTRFLSINANAANTEVMKNLKFEIEKKDCNINLKQENFKVLIAGSTHGEENGIVLEVYKNLKKEINNLKLIIAPRHLKRVFEIENLCLKENLNYGLRTKNDDFLTKDIIILDTLGELSKIYAIADVAFIGGSFNKTGGHNPLEAVIYSKPVVSGPSIKNFIDIYSILTRQNAAFVVKNKKEFIEVLKKLFIDDVFYNKISTNCNNCFKEHQGAINFVMNKLEKVLINP